MLEFDRLKIKVMNQFFSMIEKALSRQRRRLRYCAWKSVQPFRCGTGVKVCRKFKKNTQTLIYLGITYPRHVFGTKLCQIIQVDDLINHANFVFNPVSRVSLARGQTLPFSVQTVDDVNWQLLYYRALWSLLLLLSSHSQLKSQSAVIVG